MSHIPKTRFFGLNSCSRQFGSSFDHFDAVGPKSTEFGKITAITPFKVIQCHHFRYQSRASERLAINE